MRPLKPTPRAGLVRTVIEPRRGSIRTEVRELVESRELLYFLAWRDVKVRYTQTALGGAWAVLQPLLMVAVFSVFFGRFAQIESGTLPYAAFALAGLVPWTFFTNAVTGASNSIVQSANLVSKVYFPRVLIPVATVLSWVPDLIVSVLVMLIGVTILGASPDMSVALVPLLLVAIVPVAACVSIGLAALNVAYRDVRYVIPFGIQLWLFITPVIYPLSVVPEQYRWVVALNPMTGIVEGFRWAVGSGGSFPLFVMATSAASSVLLLTTSLFFFSRMEGKFADLV